MEVIYIIGPYRSSTTYGVKQNIDKAELLAVELWKLGYAIICPHKNSAFLEGVTKDETFLKGGIELLKRSDIAITTEGWEESEGSLEEIKVCKQKHIPLYHSLDQLLNETSTIY